MDTGERVDSVARPPRCWLNDARHFALHSCPPLLRTPPPLPFRVPLPTVLPPRCAPRSNPVVGGLVARQGWGGGRPTLALVPPSGSFPTGGPMHALPVRV